MITATGRRDSRRSRRLSRNGSAIPSTMIDRRDPDRSEDHRVRPLEDPEEVEEEVEVPVRARDEARRSRVGLVAVQRAEPPRLGAGVVARDRPLPDAGEPDDHDDHDQAHHRVVEHRVREERLPRLLDVLLVARVLRRGAPGGSGSASRSRLGPPARGRRDQAACAPPAAAPRHVSRPAASFDQGGDDTPRRITRYRCSPISAKISPGATSMCSE